ncbi:MAG TPA: cation diffusion facilitator family transporter [Bacillota bacterium]|nr:cation diffusion facilitator family transporter [Bacillota bacterium]
MISFLIRHFLPNDKDYQNPVTRRKIGEITGLAGVLLSLLLFICKLFIGLFTGSIAIMADAINNLSDSGSSIITMIGFRLAGKKADAEHPFGHGRIEYITGLIISMFIILMGFELARSSIDGIIHPSDVETSIIAIIILIASLAVKLYMVLFNFSWSKKINSAALRASGIDSRNDMIVTSVVIISFCLAPFTELPIDAYVGVALSLFILYSGFKAGRETIEPLLGTPPTTEFLQIAEEIVMSREAVIGIHDIVVHDYGPGRRMLSLQVEVSAYDDLFYLHDVIDSIEADLEKALFCEAAIQLDPIDVKNKDLVKFREIVINKAQKIDPRITIHDLHVVPAQDHTNLKFDCVIPHGTNISEDEIIRRLTDSVHEEYPTHDCIIKIDRLYV